MSRNRLRIAASLVCMGLLSAFTACSGGSTGPSTGTEDTITVWARSNVIGQNLLKPVMDAWNASENSPKVQLTLVPDMSAKIAAAAGAGQLPDILIADVSTAPLLMSQGLLQDLSGKLKELDYAEALAPSLVAAGADGDQRYAVPADIDLSLMYYNKTLLKKAGIEKPPASLQEVVADASAVRGLGGDDYGFYAPGQCGGCLMFTGTPSVWAAGGEVFNSDASKVTLNTPQMTATLQAYRDMWKAGAIPVESKTDTGANWNNVFAPGNVAIQFVGASLISTLAKANVPFDWDVAGIPGPTGGKSTYVGGDVFTITKDAKNADTAWNVIKWITAEEQQVNLYAKNGALTVRTDLTGNQYTAANPRLQTANELVKIGRTPRSTSSAAIFNDAAGPWLAGWRSAVYDGDVSGALAEAEQKAQQIIDKNK